MRYKLSTVFLTCIGLFILSSCGKPTELTKYFSCESKLDIQTLETVKDFNNTFSVQVPKHWKTKLYYDNLQSEIFSADTIKNLSDSYIMYFAMLNAPIQINKELQENVQLKTKENNLTTKDKHFIKFNNKEAFLHLGVREKKGLVFHVFQYYIKLNEERYMLVKIEFYGEEKFEKRLCEALHLIKKIEIFE